MSVFVQSGVCANSWTRKGFVVATVLPQLTLRVHYAYARAYHESLNDDQIEKQKKPKNKYLLTNHSLVCVQHRRIQISH